MDSLIKRAQRRDADAFTELMPPDLDAEWELGDEETGTYTVTFATNRILDTAQIDALLFLKAIPDQPGPITEENLYVVPIE